MSLDSVKSSFSINRQDATVVIELSGWFVFDGVLDIQDEVIAVTESGCERIIVDMSGVAFCDSSALSMLLRLNSAASENGIALLISEPPPPILTLMKSVGLDRIFKISIPEPEGEDTPAPEAPPA